ncbi:MAG: phospholipase D-like domain-containing protein [Candidatus Micrarchaeota archaeon]|nr:phospholipase D-like domain-containing protein [Candidatus Micrarchaeota archaeon]
MAQPKQRQFDTRDYAILILLIFIAGLFAYIAFIPATPCAGCNAKVSFIFSPGAQSDVISFINSAQESIDIEMYVFTSDDMIKALGAAQKRGVHVRIIMEPRVEDSRKQKVFDTLSALGIEMKWASMEYKLTHSKFVIVDGKKALVGSINFSMSALTLNREAAVEVEGAKVSEIIAVFETDWAKATAG